MKRFRTSLTLVFVTAIAPYSASALGTEPPHLNCEIGPLTKTFGRTSWLVYACDDGRSLVVVSGEGSPAMRFYFMFVWKGGAYQLHGEGTGDNKVTQAAFDELSKLDKAGIEGLLEEALKKGTKN
jgi:hypothetical protein